eukprot:CAMPEP_0179298372 /NCGR_PEP_ID=MMETSP0797-20121207/45957_1 /TAXON_ID=47934 /ORGANISM="Dinophysis acuminata, Strain DAEP01" /LENGTH=185 /DNA_ID=CAMNT_0021007753 /DNA_START=79 /DNA_END=637 /DNA_ORIENTATION=+
MNPLGVVTAGRQPRPQHPHIANSRPIPTSSQTGPPPPQARGKGPYNAHGVSSMPSASSAASFVGGEGAILGLPPAQARHEDVLLQDILLLLGIQGLHQGALALDHLPDLRALWHFELHVHVGHAHADFPVFSHTLGHDDGEVPLLLQLLTVRVLDRAQHAQLMWQPLHIRASRPTPRRGPARRLH